MRDGNGNIQTLNQQPPNLSPEPELL